MPGLLDGTNKKRKRKESASTVPNRQDEILLLESQILESRRHYNNITTLLGFVKELDIQDGNDQTSVTAAVALCRVFCRLIASGDMSKSRSRETSEETVTLQWLTEKLQEYQHALLSILVLQSSSVSTTALVLLLQLIKEGDMDLNVSKDASWCSGLFSKILQTLVNATTVEVARAEFVAKYFVKYDDIRYHTLVRLRWVQP